MAKSKPPKRRGYYCKVCGEHKANEKFSGKGHATHICKACHTLPVLRRNELMRMRTIERIDCKFYVPREDIDKLNRYSKDKRYPEASEYAQDVYNSVIERIKSTKPEEPEYEPILFSEMDEDSQTEFVEALYVNIGELLPYCKFSPSEKDKEELLRDLCSLFYVYDDDFNERQLIPDEDLSRKYDEVLNIFLSDDLETE
jgi:hypothetical protein